MVRSGYGTSPADVCCKTLTAHTQRVYRVAWSPDGRILASGGQERTIWLWDVEQQQYRGTLQGHTDAVVALAFTPDSRSLLSSGDSTLRVWDITNGRCVSGSCKATQSLCSMWIGVRTANIWQAVGRTNSSPFRALTMKSRRACWVDIPD